MSLIIWGPDRHLGQYINNKTGAEMVLWQGYCVVHDEFKLNELEVLMAQYPDAEVLVHPESPEAVIAKADFVGSMNQVVPNKRLIPAPTGDKSATCKSCAHCPWMAMNTLINLYEALRDETSVIEVDEVVRKKALIPLNRMLEFSHQHGILTAGDA